MYYEFSIFTDENPCKVFLQTGFYTFSQSNITHKHNYAEIHLVSGGNAVFKVANEVSELRDGEMLIIPKGIFHSWSICTSDTLHTAFQIDMDLNSPSITETDKYVVRGLFNEIAKCRESKDHKRIEAYIPLICSYIKEDRTGKSCPMADPGMIIETFFATYYDKPVSLRDLADMLHLSDRQTERLVKEHTGNTFKKELASTRITVAEYLRSTTDMSLTEIAQYVGYRSYAGFWKAIKKHE